MKTVKYGTDLLQLLMNAVSPGLVPGRPNGFVSLDVYAYNGKKDSACDTTLATFSDQQRELGAVTVDVPPGGVDAAKVLAQIQEEIIDELETDEEVGISTTIGFSSRPQADAHAVHWPHHNYFLPVLDMVIGAESFRASMATLVSMKEGGRHDPIHEFLRKYQFTVMETGKSLHLVAQNLEGHRDRLQEKFLAQALMFPSLGVDQAWVGHCIYRQWMGLRISAISRTKVPTINHELTALLRQLNDDDQQGHIGQAKPGGGGVEAVTF